MLRFSPVVAAVGLSVVLSACSAQPDPAKTSRSEVPANPPAPAATSATVQATQPAPLTPSGPPVSVSAQNPDELQQAAAVVRIDDVGDDAKLFGMGGGDPAMNGLRTFIAFFASPADGWRVFEIGDVLDYRVLSASSGRVDLDLIESTYDEASGQIGSRHRRIIVGWIAGPANSVPASVTVTPAQ